MLTSQWSSSEQARQIACLQANGFNLEPTARDISPDRIIEDLGCHVVERVATVYIPDHDEWCRAMYALRLAGLDPQPRDRCGITYREVARG